MKYLVLTAIDVEEKRYQAGEQVELMMFIGDQLVAKGILLPITEEIAPESEKKSKPKKPVEILDMVTHAKSEPIVGSELSEVKDGSINS